MFTSTEKSPYGEIPVNCSFSESDWHVLAGFWHPVAFSVDVADKPVAAKLLDVSLVIYRTVDGLAVARDLCLHRGAALSLGWLDDERKNIVCPFHGLHYDATGRCTWIPSLPEGAQRIPAKLRTIAYRAVERYGLIWVCLKETALRPLPEWPVLETGGEEWQTISPPAGLWQTSAPRHVENFNDVAHFSWVHVGTFGNRKKPYVPDYELRKTSYGLSITVAYPEVFRRPDVDGKEAEASEIAAVYHKDLTYPFATDLLLEYDRDEGGKDLIHIFDIASPISARKTAIFQIFHSNQKMDRRQAMLAYQEMVNAEDLPIVESQKPEELPLNITAELHIPADKLSVQYRRDLVEMFGLGSPNLTA